MHTTSASLLMRLKQPGQPDAWRRFVRVYSPMLHAWACRLGLQDADAADLVQDVFATLLRKLPEFNYEDHRRFRGWLWRVTKNKLREKRRRWSLPVEAGSRVEKLASHNDDSVEAADFQRHLFAQVLDILREHFEPNTWRAFWEYVIEGRAAAEVAKELGIGVGAIYTAKCRVLAKLSSEMGKQEQE